MAGLVFFLKHVMNPWSFSEGDQGLFLLGADDVLRVSSSGTVGRIILVAVEGAVEGVVEENSTGVLLSGVTGALLVESMDREGFG